jgi:hypothetical protein
MSQYLNCLNAMQYLLTSVGEYQWARWISEDIEEWEKDRSTIHHLSAYGGMGSFNDIYFASVNDHKLDPDQEPWVNLLFQWLKSVCYFLANRPEISFSSDALLKSVGRHDSALAAFRNGDKAPSSARGYASDNPVLQCWRCHQCGYSEVGPRDIEASLAEIFIPYLVFEACETRSLEKVVDQILQRDIDGLEGDRKKLIDSVIEAGIVLNDREGWMRPCPRCATDDTAVYRWKLNRYDGFHLSPAENNHPLQG